MQQEDFFKRYEIDVKAGRLGGGAFGTVYRAYDHLRDEWKAIKVAEVKFIDGKEFSLISEFEASQAIPLNKFIAHYESVEQFHMPNGLFDYAVMQYYPEGNLKQLLDAKVLPLNEKFAIVNGILQGITFLHQHLIIHRDIKPSNILIAVDSRGNYIPKIADFGLSKSIQEADISNITNSFGGGTLDYSSPEQLYGHPLRPNTDLWSFGVITYEVFLGKKPFSAEGVSGSPEAKRRAIYQKIANAQLPADVEDCPFPYGDIIRLCLIKDPKQRVKKGEDLIQFLKNPVPLVIPEEAYDEDETLILGKAKETGHEFNPIEVFQRGADLIFGKSVEINPTTEAEVIKQAEEQQRLREEEARKVAEEQRQKEEAERLIIEEEKRKAEEAAQKRAAEEQRLREEAQRKAAEEQRQREEAEHLKVEEEKRKSEEEAQKKAAEEQRLREEADRKAAEEQRQREEAERLKIEEEKRKAEEAAQMKAAEEQRLREEEARKAAEEQRQREEAKRLKVEEEKLKAEEAAQIKAAEEQRQKEEAERLRVEKEKRKAEEAVEELRRIEEAKQKASEEQLRKQEAERLSVEEEKRKAAEAAQIKAAKELRRREEEDQKQDDKPKNEPDQTKIQDDEDEKLPAFWIIHRKKIVATAAMFLIFLLLWYVKGSFGSAPSGCVIEKSDVGYVLRYNGNTIGGVYDTAFQKLDTTFARRNDSLFIFISQSGQIDFFKEWRKPETLQPEEPDSQVKANEEWENIIRMPREKVTIQILESYMKKYPGSIWEKKIQEWKKELVAKITANLNEEGVYNQTVQSQSITLCDAYLAQYPAGKYIKQVFDLKNKLVKAEEEDLWNRAKTEATISGYEIYLKNYPNGSHSAEARDAIEKIEETNRRTQETKSEANSRTNEIKPLDNAPATTKIPETAPVNENLPVLVSSIDKNMVKVSKGGMHTLGCDDKVKGCDPKEGTKTVSITPFIMGKYEVTQEQFKSVMGYNPSFFNTNPRNPVENLTYNEVMEFIKKLNNIPNNPYRYRLPTEAEWEYAALAGTGFIYSGAGDVASVAVVDDSGPLAVGRKKANAFGLYDMSGNVAEFCSDDYGDFKGGKSSTKFKVVKGGSYLEREETAKIKKRNKAETNRPYTFIGFRLVRELN